MAEAVSHAITRRRHAIVEAGTGVGKSLGYLVPVILDAVPDGRRVVISTHTLSLQDQLLRKDLPLLRQVAPHPFRAILGKGRQNYLSPRRLDVAQKMAGGTLFDDEDDEAHHLAALREWTAMAAEGTRQELDPMPHGELWEKVQSESDNCLGSACDYHGTTCFYHEARRKLRRADIMIVNHSLLFIDLALKARGVELLPPYDVAILDEAHTIESVAGEKFGVRFSKLMLDRLLSRLDNARTGRGLLRRLAHSDRARRLVAGVREHGTLFFDGVRRFVGGKAGTREIETDDFRAASESLEGQLERLEDALENLRRDQDKKELEVEVRAYRDRCRRLRGELGAVVDPEVNRVHWAECGTKRWDATLCAQFVELGTTLEETLFDNVESVIMTSATLAVRRDDGLDHVATRLGCPSSLRLQVDSPFDYENNVTLRIAKSLGEPRDDADYDCRAALWMLRRLDESEGGAFILFTSYAFMKRMHRELAPEIEARGWPVLLQGARVPRDRMLERFRADRHSVLFGTDSFWQGVDVKGDNLRLVIITRLPFPVPSQPLFKARARRIDAAGGSSFRELSMPEAIIRFKQGFGRLVRTETDVGEVAVLDARFSTKSYGRLFRAALPNLKVILE